MEKLLFELIQELKKYNDNSCINKGHNFYELILEEGVKMIKRNEAMAVIEISTYICCGNCGEVKRIKFKLDDLNNPETEKLESQIM